LSALIAISIAIFALIALGVAALFLHTVVWLLAAILGLLIYFVPSIIAAARHHEHFLWVLILNIVLGWSGIAWIALIVWAILGERREPPPRRLSTDAFNPPAR
jgi:hypothetical protein